MAIPLVEASNISFNGVVILVLVSYKILGCSSSGPGDFETLSLSNIFNIFPRGIRCLVL